MQQLSLFSDRTASVASADREASGLDHPSTFLISEPAEALPHSPTYFIHRYFARRPYSVFQHLIGSYTSRGDLILDPFLGGGVTLVEGLHLGRRVIGYDVDYMATFISRMEAVPVDVKRLKDVGLRVEQRVHEELADLYRSECDRGCEAMSLWVEWSCRAVCPACSGEVTLSEVSKTGPGAYRCDCGETFRSIDAESRPAVPVRERYRCGCSRGGTTRPAPTAVVERAKTWDEKADNELDRQGLFVPDDDIPPGDNTRQVLRRGYRKYRELFTGRNLVALAKVRRIVEEETEHCSTEMRELMLLAFTSGLFELSKLAHVKRTGVVKPSAHYWQSDVFAEKNVAVHLSHRLQYVRRAKRHSSRHIAKDVVIDDRPEQVLCGEADAAVVNRSSTSIAVPDQSVDACITDPPYGDYVNYAEMTSFWRVWIRDLIPSLQDDVIPVEEAVINETQGKGAEEYSRLLEAVFREVYRVLKPDGPFAMTFNNKHYPALWALFRAAVRAGFYLPDGGVVYQPPIRAYTTTLNQQREGSILGDFLYTFRKSQLANDEESEESWTEGRLRSLVRDVLEERSNVATLTELYSAVIPILVRRGAFAGPVDSEISDMASILVEEFEQ